MENKHYNIFGFDQYGYDKYGYDVNGVKKEDYDEDSEIYISDYDEDEMMNW